MTARDKSMQSLAERIARLAPHERAVLERRLAARAATTPDQARTAPIPVRPPGAARVLSPAQESLWLRQHMDPAAPAGILLAGVRVRGELDLDRLRTSLRELAERHETLRMTVTEDGGVPRVDVDSAAGPELIAHDRRGRPESALRDLIAAETRRPFDLARGPLLRLLSVRLGAAEHALILVMHHIAGDGRSLDVLVRDLALAYAGRLGQAPPLPIQYADYAAWQRAESGGPAMRKGREFWRRTLDGLPATLELPADLPRPARPSGRGATRTLHLDAGTAAALRAFGGGSRFMALLAGFGAVLARFTGQQRVPVATPVAGRGRPELEELVGCFVNTLVLPVDLAGDPARAETFPELVARTRDTTLECFEHQDVPLEHVIAEINPPRDLGHPPFAQAMLVGEEAARGDLDLPGLTLSPLDLGDGGIAKRELTLTATGNGADLRLDLTFDTDLFLPETAGRLLDCLDRLLRGAAADPSRPLRELLRLGPDEHHEIVHTWNRTAALPPQACVHDLFAAQARHTPEAIAVADETGTLTYERLDRDSDRLARHLRSLGVGAETPVGVCLERSCLLPLAVLAVMKAGGMYVPLAPDQPAERLRRILDGTGARVVVTSSAHLERLPASVRAVPLDDAEQRWRDGPSSPLPPVAGPAHAAYLLHTSGSTGLPKGVVVEHRQVHSYVRAVVADLGLSTGGSYAMLQPLTVDSCLTMLFPPLIGGGTLHLISAEQAADASALARYFEAAGIDYLKIAPSHLAMLLETGDDSVLPRRTLIIGGEASHWEFAGPLRDRARCAVVNHYGPTETTVGVLVHPLNEARAGVTVPIGRPLAGTTAYILDTSLNPVPVGVAGELYIGGANVTRGYWRRPAETAAAFVPDLFGGTPGARLYRTGDRARHLPGGLIEYLGRGDDQVKINGFRVEPGEVEAALLSCEGVREALVTVADGRLIAYVAAGGADLRTPLRALLPGHMIPSAFVHLDSLPRTPHGKVDRSALPPVAADPDQEPTQPRDEWERLVADVYTEVLGVPAGADADFFALGGTSLSAMAVMAGIRRRRSVQITLRDLFECPTVAALGALIRRAEKSGEPVPAPVPVPVPRVGTLPLSHAQRRLWFLHRFDPGGSTYHLPFSAPIVGDLDVEGLRRALRALLERHEVLRSVVVEEDGEPRQRVLPVPGDPLDVVDLSALPQGERRRRLEELGRRTALAPFDLSNDPPLRAVLVRTSPQEHRLLLTVHHIAADGWSIRLLARDLAALRDGRPPAPLPLQYADYAAWQDAMLEAGALRPQLDHWRERLAGPLPVLDLPADHVRPSTRSAAGDTHLLELPVELAERLREVGKRHGATLFMVLLAAQFALLSRLTGASDLIVGTVVSGRSRPEFDEVVGCFVNTLAVRADLAGDPSFTDLLGRVRAETLAAFANQDVPFDRVVEAVAPERDPSRHPIFQVVMSLDEGDTGQGDSLATGTAKFDLLAAYTANPGRFAVALEYSTELYTAETVARWADHLAQTLRQAADDPGRPLSELGLMEERETTELTAAWNATAVGYPRDLAVHTLFERQAALHPDAVALVLPERQATLSYGELDALTNRLARYLHARGVRPGDRVGLLMERSADLVVAELAVLKAGAAYVPFETDTPAARLEQMLRDTGAEIVLTSSAFLHLLPTGAIALDQAGPELAGLPAHGLGLPARADQLAYIMYTSGSTGVPKGIAIPHRGIVRLVVGSDLGSLSSADVLLQVAPAAFDSVTFEVWGALLNGARLVMAPPGRPSLSEIERLVLEHGVTVLLLTAGLFHQLADHRPGVLRALDRLLSGGDVMLAGPAGRALRSAPGLELANCYGPTETTTLATRHRVTEQSLTRPSIPIGGPISNTTVHVLDRRMRPVPVGVLGEIYIGGDGLAWGYWRRPGLTAAAFVPDPFSPGARLYRSGDLGRRLPDGEIEFLGRGDHQVKIRGFRVELGEVETVLGRHPALRAAVAGVSRPDNRLIAHVLLRDDCAEADTGRLERELIAWMAERVPGSMVPSAVVVVDEFPLTGNFKVDRAALPAPDWAGRGGTYREPEGREQRELAEIFAEVLDVPVVGADDDFFALGGHSLLATGVLARIHDRFGVELPVRTLFERPTVAGLAAGLTAGPEAEPGDLLPPILPGRGPAPLSSAQRRLWFLHQLDPGSTAYHMHGRWRLTGPLDPELLERCLRAVIDRHQALRTVFPSVDGRPAPRVLPAQAWTMRRAEPAGGPSEALRLCDAEAATVFDLERGPLIRACLLRTGDDEHILTVTAHHIVADGWSVGLLADELSRLYLNGGGTDLPELPVQYGDYARWQQEALSGGALAPHLEYWLRTLEGAPTSIDLPRNADGPPRGGTAAARLDGDAASAVRKLFAAHGVTTFMGMLAAMATVLSRWSGQSDVVVGVPIASRRRTELEHLIGLFMNTLAMRVNLAGAPTFAELLDRVREVALGAYAHQDLPFEKLIEELQPERDLGRSPLIQVALNVVNVAKAGLSLPGLDVEPLGEAETTPKFDLTLYVSEDEDALELTLSYRAELYEPELMRDFLGQLARLLRAAARDPDRHVFAYPLADEEPGPALAVRGPTRLPLPNQAPDQDGIALADAAGAITYGELERAANRLAHHLIETGVRPGDVVPLAGTRSARLVVAMLACHKAGAAFAVVDPAHPPRRRQRMIEAVGGRPVLELHEHPADGRPDTPPGVDGAAAYAMFTSGSTGTPNAVLGGPGPVAHFVDWHIATFGLTMDDRFALLSGLGYDPVVRDVFTPMRLGATLHIPGADVMADPALIGQWLAGNRITVVHLTPPMLRPLAEMSGPLPDLRLVFSGGDRLTPDDVARLRRVAPGARCVSFYGATETPQAMAYTEVDADDPPWHRLGEPVDGVDLIVADAMGRPAALGEIGELWVRTPYLAWGYAGRPGLTAERFVAGPGGGRIYRTGDRARRRPGGSLEFLGRGDRQVKVRGHRVEPGEVEAALSRHTEVTAAAVKPWRESDLVAYVAASGDPDLAAFARQELPEHAVPARIIRVDALPLTANGKVDWDALPEPAAAPAAGPRVPPSTPLQKALAAIWADLLDRAEVGVRDDFFALGGHSLLATTLVARARAELDADLGVRDLFEAPTVEQLALVIVERRVAAEEELLTAIETMSDDEVEARLRELS
uniref:non-ribosomal peptide synthetase n=1 Tax=Nonomuraea pusilla TaxID=46177 RepID=UPI0006E12383|nr:non-ribosomal peptide synthetase [Nonomuraea pusilla]